MSNMVWKIGMMASQKGEQERNEERNLQTVW